MKNLIKYLFLMLMMIGAIVLLNMKAENSGSFTVAFYNVENLFDTINDPHSNDDKFLPLGKGQWTSNRYYRKIENLGEAIRELGDADGPEIIGVSEVENKLVLKDLISSQHLKDRGYDFIQFDSDDKRGIDVALIYKKQSFFPYSVRTKSIEIKERKNFRTRDILIVSGKIGIDTIHFLLNHWPSRLGGKEKSEGSRIAAATAARKTCDSLFQISAKARIVVMGDFNDEPSDRSISEVLKARAEYKDCKPNDLYNPFYRLMVEGVGTYKYEGQWDMLDQIMISGSMVENKKLGYKRDSEDVYDPDWLFYKKNRAYGPHRTYLGSKYYGGYSDHFPVFIHLDLERKQQ